MDRRKLVASGYDGHIGELCWLCDGSDLVKWRLGWAGHIVRMFDNILRNKLWKNVSGGKGTPENQGIDVKEKRGIIPPGGPECEIGAHRQGRSNWKKEKEEEVRTRTGRRMASRIFFSITWELLSTSGVGT